jgi:23S rRNA (cytosine1962-C5)-methyltransferase
MSSPKILITKSSADYELIDSGEGEKLERFGKVVLSRPDPQALWPKRLVEKEWKRADAYFGKEAGQIKGQKDNGEKGGWTLRKELPSKWTIDLAGLKFWIKPTAFKHVGIFPEQSPNWERLRELISSRAIGRDKGTIGSAGRAPVRGIFQQENSVSPNHAPMLGDEIEILNLFGYTGGATLACAQVGAKVVHIDGSKAAITWARNNAELSGLKDKPIRWIVEDARTFVEREIRRGHSYDGIIMDPPSFGHGPESELWKIEEHFLTLIENCKKLLKPKPLFFLINGYSSGYSAIAYENNLLSLKEKFGGEIEIGELAIEEKLFGSNGGNDPKAVGEPQRLLPCGIFARWSK